MRTVPARLVGVANDDQVAAFAELPKQLHALCASAPTDRIEPKSKPGCRIALTLADEQRVFCGEPIRDKKTGLASLDGQLLSVRQPAPDADHNAVGILHRERPRSAIPSVAARIEKKRINAEAAVKAEIAGIAQNFEDMDDPYLRARAQEIREVGMRIVRNLIQEEFRGFTSLEVGSIVVAEEITPADTALMDPRLVGGFASVLGGAEGHTAIMARSLGLPAVLGVGGLLGTVKGGETVIVDGSDGLIYVNPSAARLKDYRARRAGLARAAQALTRLRDVPAATRDGERVRLQANLEFPREVGHAVAVGAEGVGLPWKRLA